MYIFYLYSRLGVFSFSRPARSFVSGAFGLCYARINVRAPDDGDWDEKGCEKRRGEKRDSSLCRSAERAFAWYTKTPKRITKYGAMMLRSWALSNLRIRRLDYKARDFVVCDFVSAAVITSLVIRTSFTAVRSRYTISHSFPDSLFLFFPRRTAVSRFPFVTISHFYWDKSHFEF